MPVLLAHKGNLGHKKNLITKLEIKTRARKLERSLGVVSHYSWQTTHQTSTSFSYWPKFNVKNHHWWWEVGLQLQPDNFQLNSPQLLNHKAVLQMRPVHSGYFFPNIYWVVYFNIKHETTLLKMKVSKLAFWHPAWRANSHNTTEAQQKEKRTELPT